MLLAGPDVVGDAACPFALLGVSQLPQLHQGQQVVQPVEVLDEVSAVVECVPYLHPERLFERSGRVWRVILLQGPVDVFVSLIEPVVDLLQQLLLVPGQPRPPVDEQVLHVVDEPLVALERGEGLLVEDALGQEVPELGVYEEPVEVVVQVPGAGEDVGLGPLAPDGRKQGRVPVADHVLGGAREGVEEPDPGVRSGLGVRGHPPDPGPPACLLGVLNRPLLPVGECGEHVEGHRPALDGLSALRVAPPLERELVHDEHLGPLRRHLPRRKHRGVLRDPVTGDSAVVRPSVVMRAPSPDSLAGAPVAVALGQPHQRRGDVLDRVAVLPDRRKPLTGPPGTLTLGA